MEFLPNIEPFRSHCEELEKKLSLPETFQDNQIASKLSRDHRRLKEILELYDSIQNLQIQINDCESLLDDPEMGAEAKKEIEMLEKKIGGKKEHFSRRLSGKREHEGRPVRRRHGVRHGERDAAGLRLRAGTPRARNQHGRHLSLIHISEPTRRS